MSEADELARRAAGHLNAREGTSRAFGIALDEARAGYARASMTVRADMLNGHAIGHGGMIFLLADTAFAYACNSRNVNTLAQQASIVFLAPAKEGDRLVAEAREQSLSGRSGVYLVRVRTQEGKDIAVFTGLSRSVGGAVVD
ncbi:MAG: hydroxyphenylacetyl-CoA thioesterase PaaI [Alphaproteobacteria bacterium]|nr:hydroxyphenylacetyl-CoA thioesterase PaaI [Alphaproteobacteria bacterium]